MVIAHRNKKTTKNTLASARYTFLDGLPKRTRTYILSVLLGAGMFLGYQQESTAQTAKSSSGWEIHEEPITPHTTTTPSVMITPENDKDDPVVAPKKSTVPPPNSFFDEPITPKTDSHQGTTPSQQKPVEIIPPKNTTTPNELFGPVEPKLPSTQVNTPSQQKPVEIIPPKNTTTPDELFGPVEPKLPSTQVTTPSQQKPVETVPQKNTPSQQTTIPVATPTTLEQPAYLEIQRMRQEILDLAHSLQLYEKDDPKRKEIINNINSLLDSRIYIIIEKGLWKNPSILAQEIPKEYLGNGVSYEQIVTTISGIKDVHLQKAFLKQILCGLDESFFAAQELFGMQDWNSLSASEKKQRTYTIGKETYVYYPYNLIQYNPVQGKGSPYVLLTTITQNTGTATSSSFYKPYVLSSYKLQRIQELSSTRTYMVKDEILSAPETPKEAKELGVYVVVPKDVKIVYQQFLQNSLSSGGKAYAIISKTNFKIYLFSAQHILVGRNDVLLGSTTGDQQNNPYKAINTTPGGSYVVGDKFITSDFTSKYGTHYISFLPLDNQYVLKEDANGKLIYTLGIHGLYIKDITNRGDAIHSSTLSKRRASHGCGNVDTDEFDQIYDHLISGSIVYVTFESSGTPTELFSK